MQCDAMQGIVMDDAAQSNVMHVAPCVVSVLMYSCHNLFMHVAVDAFVFVRVHIIYGFMFSIYIHMSKGPV